MYDRIGKNGCQQYTIPPGTYEQGIGIGIMVQALDIMDIMDIMEIHLTLIQILNSRCFHLQSMAIIMHIYSMHIYGFIVKFVTSVFKFNACDYSCMYIYI